MLVSSSGGSISCSTLHAGGAELLPGQVDGVVVLLGVTLLPLLEIRPTADVLQTLLRVPHRDQLLGLTDRHSFFVLLFKTVYFEKLWSLIPLMETT